MKISDLFSSILLLVFAATLWFGAQQLPNPGDQLYGPAFFPSCIAALIALSAGLLAFSSWRNQMSGADKASWVQLESWTREPKIIVRFAFIPIAVIFYIYSVEILGFLLVSTLVLLSLFLILGVSRLQAFITAICVALLIYGLFDMGLRVPLPRGDLFFD